MEVGWKIYVAGFMITFVLFSAILFSSALLNTNREAVVIDKMANIVENYQDMQTVLWMSEFLGNESSCIALQGMIARMNKGLWDLGRKIDQYRQATEQFASDPFYLEQKREFNRQEVLYFSTLKGLRDRCNINQTIVPYFYRKKEICPDCDAQSFVLTDIKKDLESNDLADELSIFSFDADIDLAAIELLTRYYNISSYPCIVIEDKPYCGLHSKAQVKSILCNSTSLTYCTAN